MCLSCNKWKFLCVNVDSYQKQRTKRNLKGEKKLIPNWIPSRKKKLQRGKTQRAAEKRFQAGEVERAATWTRGSVEEMLKNRIRGVLNSSTQQCSTHRFQLLKIPNSSLSWSSPRNQWIYNSDISTLTTRLQISCSCISTNAELQFQVSLQVRSHAVAFVKSHYKVIHWYALWILWKHY